MSSKIIANSSLFSGQQSATESIARFIMSACSRSFLELAPSDIFLNIVCGI